MLKSIFKSIAFKSLTLLSSKVILKTNDKVVYLTFDDGPEPKITEYILELLESYKAKATFFCTGLNIENYPELYKMLVDNGHSIGNHSYSHINLAKADNNEYVSDVTKCRNLINSDLFRPPWGKLNVMLFLKLKNKYRIILWDIDSKDYKDNVNWDEYSNLMVKKTKTGNIVLFHFSNQHQENTKLILPLYMEKLNRLGFEFKAIK